MKPEAYGHWFESLLSQPSTAKGEIECKWPIMPTFMPMRVPQVHGVLRGARLLACHCETDTVGRSNLVVRGRLRNLSLTLRRDCRAPVGRSQ